MTQRLVRALLRSARALVVLWAGLVLVAIALTGAVFADLIGVGPRGLAASAALLMAVALAVGVTLWLGRPRVPRRVILEIDLERGVIENLPGDPLSGLVVGRLPVLREVVEALETAAGDERVVALVARVGAGRMGLAQAQELRRAVTAFREAGKASLAFAETFGEFGPGNLPYYLAAAFEEVVLQPSGDVGLTGLLVEAAFLRGTIDKLGVTPRLDQRREYKTAMNRLTERAFTEAHRESAWRVTEDQFGQIVEGIAEGRSLSSEEVRSIVDRGPFFGEEALEAGLVDRLAYRDQLYSDLEQRFGKVERLGLIEYSRRSRRRGRGETIALVHALGAVRRGRSGFDPRLGGMAVGSDTVTAALRAARADRRVKAILLRIDSPGGSYVASDAIWREVRQTREAGKPVVASMGNVAGSGGYFIALAADAIVAQPGTVTGSIGVVGGKLLTSGFWEKLGLSWDEVHTGRRAGMWSSRRDYTPEEWDRFQQWLDRVYGDFKAKVAEARGLSDDRAEELAKGRIWSGSDAKAHGLIDELGGLAEARQHARRIAGIPDEALVRLKAFPVKPSPLRRVLERGREDRGFGPPEQVLAAVSAVRGLIGAVRGLDVLSMPEVLDPQ